MLFLSVEAKLPFISQMTELQIQTIAKVNQISNKFLRDLAWLLYLPSISSPFLAENLNYQFEEEDQLGKLNRWIEDMELEGIDSPIDTLPLGKYAERLIEFYLKSNSNYELLAHNLQINEEQLTVGEVDYLFQELYSKANIHLEFAIKYYLKVNFQGQERFLGPSAKDWFQRKLTKLSEHQSQYTLQYAHLLPIRLQKLNFQPKIMVKGALFYPYVEWGRANNKNYLIEGWWIGIEQLSYLAPGENRYELKEGKRQWVFPFYTTEERLDYNELKLKLNQLLVHRNEVLVVRYTVENQLIDFGFVVRKNWPN